MQQVIRTNPWSWWY